MNRTTVRTIVASGLILAVGAPGIALGAGEGRTLLLGKRNPTGSTGGVTAETQIIADNTTYSTRQSNKRVGDGGAAIYGCRSLLTAESCLRANNLNKGLAFSFNTEGDLGGTITTNTPTGAPFTTNATGVATGLNADRVDGREGADLLGKTDKAADADQLDGRDSGSFASAVDLRTAKVAETGTLNSGRGATGASVGTAGANSVYTVVFDRDVSSCSWTATPRGSTPAATAIAASATDNKAIQVTATAPTALDVQVICG